MYNCTLYKVLVGTLYLYVQFRYRYIVVQCICAIYNYMEIVSAYLMTTRSQILKIYQKTKNIFVWNRTRTFLIITFNTQGQSHEI